MTKVKTHGSTPKAHLGGSLFYFALHYWRPTSTLISMSGAAMVLATLLGMAIPLSAKDIMSYSEGMSSRVTSQVNKDPLSPSFPGSSPALVRDVSVVVGIASERFYGDFASTVVETIWGTSLGAFSRGLISRCLFMATLIVLYHQISLFAHLKAYKAGLASQIYLVKDSLHRILSTQHPERIAVVSASKISHMFMDCGKTVSDTLGGLLTNVLPSLLSAVAILAILLYISFTLTVCIGLIVALVQYAYYRVCRYHTTRDAQLAAQEAMIHDTLSNIIQRSETIFVTNCEDFVLGKLQTILFDLTHMRTQFDRAIHGNSAVFSTAITLVFVAMLGALTHLSSRGELVLMDIALYFVLLHQFVGRVQELSAEVGRLRTGLGRLRTLQQALHWFEAPPAAAAGVGCEVVVEEGNHGATATLSPRQLSHQNRKGKAKSGHDGAMAGDAARPSPSSIPFNSHLPLASPAARLILHEGADVGLELCRVSFTYGAAPSFLCGGGGGAATTTTDSAGVGSRGIRGVSLRAAAGRITTLYGPSGCGKSTCLRLLAGFLRPHRGVVRTQRRPLLLEQHPAVFLGSVAENIVLQDLSPSLAAREHLKGQAGKGAPKGDAAMRPESFLPMEKRLNSAMRDAGCNHFVTDAFHTYIDNVNHPPFSGGQLQRICLARVFDRTQSCSLVLLDEPTTGLDADTVEQLLVTIKELRDMHNKTVLIATHDQRVASISDAVIHLSASNSA